MRKNKFFTAVCLTLVGVGLALADTIVEGSKSSEVVNITDGVTFDVNNATITRVGNHGHATFMGDRFDYFENGDFAEFNVKNDKEQKFSFSFTASTTNNNTGLEIIYLKGDQEIYASGKIDVDNDGSWSNFTNEYTQTSGLIPTDVNKVKIVFYGPGTTLNCTNLKLTPVDSSITTYDLTTSCNPANGGKVQVAPNASSFEPGTEVTLTAVPSKYFIFKNWTDQSGVAGTDLSLKHVMDAPYSVTANFEESPLLIPTTDSNPFYTEWAECERGSWNGGNLDSYRDGGTATYNLRATKETGYNLKFKAGTANPDETTYLNFAFIQNGSTVYQTDVDILGTGGWQSYLDYTVAIPVIPAGDYTFVVTFNTSASYTCNVKDIQLREDVTRVNGDIESLTISGVAADADVIAALNGSTHTATITRSITEVPAIQAMFAGTGEPVNLAVDSQIDGTTLTCYTSITNAGAEVTYKTVFTNFHAYEMAGNDKMHTIYPNSGIYADGMWTDNEVSLNCGGDWAFKLANEEYTLSFPSNWQVKQIVFRLCADNYASTGYVASFASQGATVYMPYDFSFIQDKEKNMVFNIANHSTGTPFVFSLADVNQATIKFIDIVYEEVAVSAAPELKSFTTSPTEGKNHCVVSMTFDHAVATAEAVCNGVTVKPFGEGTPTVNFSVWDLDYNSAYTLTIPAGKLADAYGNANKADINVSFTTGQKPVIDLSQHDYEVSTVAELRSAVAAANEADKALRKVIFVKNGEYNLGAEELSIRGSNIYLIGESREGVLIRGNRSDISNPVVTSRYGTDIYLENLTIRNDKNWRASEKGGVGVAFTGGQRTVCYHVTLQSNQDTYVSQGDGLFLECDIHGTVDFICGGGDVYFDRCNLILEDRGGDVITAPSTAAANKWGYVFQNCTVKAAEGASQVVDGGFDLGRPWQNAPRSTYLNTTFMVLPSAAGWRSMSGQLYTYFFEYGSMDAAGNLLDLSTRNVIACQSANGNYTPVLTAEQAKAFTMYNVLGSTDSWNPMDMFDNTNGSEGIEGIVSDQISGNSAIYNIYGQRVDASYKGIVICNGKKFYQR